MCPRISSRSKSQFCTEKWSSHSTDSKQTVGKIAGALSRKSAQFFNTICNFCAINGHTAPMCFVNPNPTSCTLPGETKKALQANIGNEGYEKTRKIAFLGLKSISHSTENSDFCSYITTVCVMLQSYIPQQTKRLFGWIFSEHKLVK